MNEPGNNHENICLQKLTIDSPFKGGHIKAILFLVLW